MSAKNIDKYNRFRSITVAFRVSPEEQKELNRAIALSGLPKQSNCSFGIAQAGILLSQMYGA